MEVEAVSCECCGLEEECTGDYIGGVRAYFGGRWLCGLCSEAVKYEAGKCARGAGAGAAAPPDVEEAVRAHMAICRTLKGRGGPAGRVADGMCQMLRTASWKKTASSSSSAAASSPRGPAGPPPRLHRLAAVRRPLIS
ncbi:hypothetical protein BDA96_01G095900 [Sorghum bicolor]|jgi:hypothetical protein|uniref:DUF1677 family protein n=2 Tax=Sorghum bicolor TaxID=4558 RepID=A0A921RW33_SORBI|nr:uncharacterized protein LOC8060476 [Sorghum bicolor]EER93465.1 hypothetical protein SORBI_3001G091600 [Sorghum bicolor]KAG0547619.1 hypothetical protein BDA96_01G095900 [Sorghum bicolor]|eukprot:XP_002466467.1 uncharacterized protein LOC8060476 [Sorghum bicolor]